MIKFLDLPNPGTYFDGKYFIESEIGAGATSKVFRAQVRGVERTVALKFLMSDDPNGIARRRFRREAQAMSNLRSPYTIRLFDYDETELGSLYMVLEYVEGESLFTRIQQGKFRVERALRLIAQVLESLKETHEAGIVHRDIKPANILLWKYLDDDDCVKVIDFGIAKPIELTGTDASDLTLRNIAVGTPRYMSPEQMMGLALTPAADVYAVGHMLAEMILGYHLVRGSKPAEVLDAHLRPEPFSIPLAIEEPVRRIIGQMIAKRTSDRYPNVDACLGEINALLATGILNRRGRPKTPFPTQAKALMW